MIIINSRDELNAFLYGGSDEYSTLVGIARIGGELLDEAMSDPYRLIVRFFPSGDEGEYIEVSEDGTIIGDFIYN